MWPKDGGQEGPVPFQEISANLEKIEISVKVLNRQVTH